MVGINILFWCMMIVIAPALPIIIYYTLQAFYEFFIVQIGGCYKAFFMQVMGKLCKKIKK
jgi:hypothetical protein